jgi:glycosyltransferase involved in cell wall biosynthesis
MPRFTIGIPTYNRANFLKRSLACALDQTHSDVEIIVSDNASPDDTSEVVKSFGDRVRYHRNPTNLGATANFERALELASGDFFSWLQDDDLIHRDFVRRALEGFALGGDVAAYLCFSISTPSPTSFYHPLLTGPTFPLRWMQGGMSTIDGILLSPVSLFYSPGNPPALAYRVDALREAIRTAKHRCELFDERILLATATVDQKVALDPWTGAIFTHHANQSYRIIFNTDPFAQEREWYILANAVGDLLQGKGDGWKEPLMEVFRGIDLDHRLSWLNNYCPPAPHAWRKAHPIAAEVRSMLIETIPEDARDRIVSKDGSRMNPLDGRLKIIAKDLMPPILWKTIRAARGRRTR